MRDATQALLVIDVQNDFCPGGALAVPGGDEIVPGINALMAEFPAVILTQDWHPADHLSFASQHPGKAPMEMTEMPYGPQVLWPDHCVQGSRGRRVPPRSRHHPRRPDHPQGFPPRDRQLFRLLRKRPEHAHRARRLPQDARHHDS
jgi:nicotinamidase/pyrazinamidase